MTERFITKEINLCEHEGESVWIVTGDTTYHAKLLKCGADEVVIQTCVTIKKTDIVGAFQKVPRADDSYTGCPLDQINLIELTETR